MSSATPARSASKCYKGWSFAYNAWEGPRCGPTDRTLGRSPFVSTAPGLEDFHLVPGRARSLVVPQARGLALSTDMEGRTRPLRYPSDAGALERETAHLALGISIGSAVMGMPRAVLLRRYGPPRRTRPTTIGIRKTRAQTDSSRCQVVVNATTVGDRVVGLASRSPFYSTSKGLGPGSPASDVPRAGWAVCKDTIRRRVGGAIVTLRLGKGKKPKIVEVAMLRRPMTLRARSRSQSPPGSDGVSKARRPLRDASSPAGGTPSRVACRRSADSTAPASLQFAVGGCAPRLVLRVANAGR